MSSLSSGERQFLNQGIEVGVRNDGRGLLDCRPFTVEMGVMQNANGSARVRLDSTEVLVCVKAEIGPPDSAHPNSGKMECTVEWCVFCDLPLVLALGSGQRVLVDLLCVRLCFVCMVVHVCVCVLARLSRRRISRVERSTS